MASTAMAMLIIYIPLENKSTPYGVALIKMLIYIFRPFWKLNLIQSKIYHAII